MEIKVVRRDFTDESTIGQMYINETFECFTLEDKIRDLKADGSGKVYGKTAIPKGRYEVVVTYSNRFKQMMPLLLGVPFFEGIRIHPGNKSVDTHGCILVGTTKGKDEVTSSKVAYNKLFDKLVTASKTEKIFIEIV